MENRCEDCKHDEEKRKWPDGPWKTEPDRVEFEHAGLNCLLHRNHMGGWCGYVGVPPGHPLHGKAYNDYDDMPDLDVHGGLTYSGHCGGAICHTPKPGEPEHLFWFGFDCGHHHDWLPGLAALGLMTAAGTTYRDLGYVRAETERLADQIAAIGKVTSA